MMRVEDYEIGSTTGGKEQETKLVFPRSAEFLCVGADRTAQRAYIFMQWCVEPGVIAERQIERTFWLVALHHECETKGVFLGMVSLTTGDYFVFEDMSNRKG